MLLLLLHLSDLALLLRGGAAFAAHRVSFRILTLERLVVYSGRRGRLLFLYPQHHLLLGCLFFMVTDFNRLLLLINYSVLCRLFLDDPICRPRDFIVDISPLLLLLR